MLYSIIINLFSIIHSTLCTLHAFMVALFTSLKTLVIVKNDIKRTLPKQSRGNKKFFAAIWVYVLLGGLPLFVHTKFYFYNIWCIHKCSIFTAVFVERIYHTMYFQIVKFSTIHKYEGFSQFLEWILIKHFAVGVSVKRCYSYHRSMSLHDVKSQKRVCPYESLETKSFLIWETKTNKPPTFLELEINC